MKKEKTQERALHPTDVRTGDMVERRGSYHRVVEVRTAAHGGYVCWVLETEQGLRFLAAPLDATRALVRRPGGGR